jgi:CDP-glycerol glycerophosphotransferase (TagB/SpsB family)
VLVRVPTELERINVPEERVGDSSKKKILLVPTWGTAGEKHWSNHLPQFTALARRHDVEFFIKPHPYEATALAKAPLAGGNGVTVLPAAADLYPLLPRFDAMVTDHSSMAFDAFLLDLPIVFLEPNDRRFYMTEMLEPPVGASIASFAELEKLPALLDAARGCSENRRGAAVKYFETPPLEASGTIHQTILGLMRAA